MIAIVAFSFGLSPNEPNPCNLRLAQEVLRIYETEPSSLLIISQWEISQALSLASVSPDLSIENESDRYLGSEEVVRKAIPFLKERGVSEVIIVANPFLHLFKCRKLFRSNGFVVVKRRVGWIGFYKDSLQPWTRGPFRLSWYALKQALHSKK